jgi:hypothetical protein
MNLPILMADGEGLDFLQYWTQPSSAVGELALVFGIVLFVVLLIFAWATFWRKPRRRSHSYHHARASGDAPAVGLPRRRKRRPWLLRVLRRHRRRRRHRRHHRPANPTLADVGGLPPARHQPPSMP